ncbi:hypothetical protein PPL_03855 [Heterostelium album PN500]|uniref:Uncharacterized protein n=1 Tax=Heterostelium pallidum (strain ATCC 26659 / Pp 5 / PN500) TaxID=670386 RepID=D3B6U7_HETP5|nr:hypothetical protein PPL_03855 [Heterostelium album PN500]EFA83067.1 hypothetical protein PPL_03855 [Heterostelium album PN500]|eukprot:XP_020435184.1 hypothetical protein PPL_03855 [Heterostelium album PN500]
MDIGFVNRIFNITNAMHATIEVWNNSTMSKKIQLQNQQLE